MANGECQVFVCDYHGNHKQELDKSVITDKLRWKLRDVNTTTIGIHPLDPKAASIKCVELEIQVWIDEQLAWWGVPMRSTAGPEQIKYQVDGIESHLKTRCVEAGSLLYTSIDQLSIGWNLVSYAQTGTNMDLNISASSFGPSGVPRSRNYPRDQHPFIYDLLMAFSTITNGFEWEIKCFGDGRREFTPYYPTKGTHLTNLTLEWGRNIKDFTVVNDFYRLATKVYATGGTDGTAKFEGQYEDTTASAKFGKRLAVVSAGSEMDPAWLTARAQQEVTLRNQPDTSATTLSALRIPVEYLGVVTPGDYLKVVIDHGAVQVNQEYRIGTIAWDPLDPPYIELTWDQPQVLL